GRAVTKASLHDLLAKEDLDPLTFLDLDQALVSRELARAARRRRSGPSAENMLRDLDGGG
ncbi:pyruvate ferredoxin oxidoreductase, partial [Nonomuraea zeae]